MVRDATVCVLQLPTTRDDEISSASKAGLIAGVTVGAVVLVGVAVAVVVLVVKHRGAASARAAVLPASP